ncbi:MAG: AAA family ATPase [Deltaproteobacteria bacterium]|nr:AAA family ATPase [Deltaproteobacteria bacterium]
MKYYSLLNLTREPFSNSPDPEMFFKSSQHQGCVQRLELAIHLRRGLSVVIGDIGTGKSTISRHLLRLVRDNNRILAHLVLTPEFNSPEEFLLAIARTFSIDGTANKSAWQLKDMIKDYLFAQAAQLDRIPVLIIDEGQKLPLFCIEILREFLNYETNQHKLLQIIIFAQKEFKHILRQKANFTDRIASLNYLSPMNLIDTRRMIAFRLRRASPPAKTPPRLFPPRTIFMIYLVSGGYPRKIVMLCSKLLIALLVKHKKRAGILDVLGCLRETGNFVYGKIFKLAAALLIVSAAMALLVNYTISSRFAVIARDSWRAVEAVFTPSLAPTRILPKKTARALPTRRLPQTPPIKKQQASSGTTTVVCEGLPIADFSRLPHILGKLPVEAHTTLSEMVALVYGRYTRARVQMVMAANKKIHTADRLPAGYIIKFPREEKNGFRPKPHEFWLELSVKDNLAAAYKTLNNYPRTTPVIIVPTLRTKNKGETTPAFLLVAEKRFSEKKAAESALKKLPAKLQKTAIIRRG